MEAPRPEPVGPSAAVVTDSQDNRPAGDTRAASAAPDDRDRHGADDAVRIVLGLERLDHVRMAAHHDFRPVAMT